MHFMCFIWMTPNAWKCELFISCLLVIGVFIQLLFANAFDRLFCALTHYIENAGNKINAKLYIL